VIGLRGSIFRILEELEFAALELSSYEEGRKIETFHRKSKRNFKPKVGKILIGMSLLEQAPCFATEKHIIMMNSQQHHVLRRPNLQVLRRLKVYKTTCSGKIQQLNECINIHEQPRKANVFGDV
jgi:hypothetical protein